MARLVYLGQTGVPWPDWCTLARLVYLDLHGLVYLDLHGLVYLDLDGLVYLEP